MQKFIIRQLVGGRILDPVYTYWTGNTPSTNRGDAAPLPLAQAKEIVAGIREQRIACGHGVPTIEILPAAR